VNTDPNRLVQIHTTEHLNPLKIMVMNGELDMNLAFANKVRMLLTTEDDISAVKERQSRCANVLVFTTKASTGTRG